MKDERFLTLIEEKRYEEVENFWLEKMESGDAGVNELLDGTRLLARHKEKDRANLLLSLLAEYFREKGESQDRLRVLLEIVRYVHESHRLDELKQQIAETLAFLYPGRRSFDQIFRHLLWETLSDPTAVRSAVEEAEWWLSHDVGQAFYQPGYGCGRVKEINLNLKLVRLDFENRKDVALQVGDREVISLPEGHILREKLDAPLGLREAAAGDPPGTIARLLRDFGRPMAVGEIKECLTDIVPSEQWNRWWTAARKHPQLLVSGKGAQATYAWSDSSMAAEESLRERFDTGTIATKIELAKQHSGRGGALEEHFRKQLLSEARKAFEERRPEPALELRDLLCRWSIDPGFTTEDVVRQQEPAFLLQQIQNASMKLGLLEMIPTLFSDRWSSIFVEAFTKEENPKLLSFIYDRLKTSFPESADALLEKIFATPFLYPAAFAWVSQIGAAELDLNNDPIGRRLKGKFLVSLLTAIDEPEFSPFRTKIKKAMEGGLLKNVLAHPLETEVVQKALELLENARGIEDYRKDRWRSMIRMRFPDTKKREDLIFSTREAFERKRGELERLIKVDLPSNRKAVGEAAALGDLRENFEYKAARERQEYLIHRVEQLQADLSRVRVLDPATIDISEVRPGVRVVLTQSSEKRLTVTILGPWDSNPQEAVYSYQAPMAAALLGHVAGDKVQWSEEPWTIEKIEPWM